MLVLNVTSTALSAANSIILVSSAHPHRAPRDFYLRSHQRFEFALKSCHARETGESLIKGKSMVDSCSGFDVRMTEIRRLQHGVVIQANEEMRFRPRQPRTRMLGRNRGKLIVPFFHSPYTSPST